MNVASLELCKELYELSRWENTYHIHDTALLGMPETEQDWCPAYDLGYLRDKLASISPKELFGTDLRAAIKYTESLKRVLLRGEDATAAFAIELFKQGVLKRNA